MSKELCDGMDIMRWTEEDAVTELKSGCCGADVTEVGKVSTGEIFGSICPSIDYCSQCHKPCKVKEEKNA